MRRFLLLVACIGAVLPLALPAAASDEQWASEAPPLVGVVMVGKVWRVQPLDPRTLQPLSHRWSKRVSRGALLVRSPLGRGVAADGLYLDSRSGRALRRPAGLWFPYGPDGAELYWFGGERFGVRGGATVVGGWQESGSFDYWWQYSDLDHDQVSVASTDDSPYTVVREGVVAPDQDEVVLVGGVDRDGFTSLDTLVADGNSYAQVVGDVLHDRIYALTFDGVVAQVDHIAGRKTVSHHHVILSGKPFEAAWAGQGKIALWGADGLGTIDTHTWTTQTVAPEAEGALTTAYGIVAWRYDAPGGISVYRGDGTRRFTVLEGKTVPLKRNLHPVAAGRYLYVFTGDERYTIDLAAGRVISQARLDARLALPSYTALP